MLYCSVCRLMANLSLNNSPHQLYSAEYAIILLSLLVSTGNVEIRCSETKSYIDF